MSPPRGGAGFSCSGSSGCSRARLARKSAPSRTVRGQGRAVSTPAQTRMAVGMARNIPLPLSRSCRPTSSGLPSQTMAPCSMTRTRVA